MEWIIIILMSLGLWSFGWYCCFRYHYLNSEQKINKQGDKAFNINLREKFFNECTDKDVSGLRRINMTPHNIFEWFKENTDLHNNVEITNNIRVHLREYLERKLQESWDKMGDTGNYDYGTEKMNWNEENFWCGYYIALEELEGGFLENNKYWA